MRRLTTPTHTFDVEFDLSIVKTIRIVYKQGNVVRLVKYNPEMEIDGNTISLKLTQEETQKFLPVYPVKIQMDLLTLGGEALHSDLVQRSIEDVLLDEVIT